MFDAGVILETPSLASLIAHDREQIPFAASIALNDTINQVQAAIQTSLAQDFTLRRASFIVNTIYRKPGQDFATKTNLVGTVRVNPDRDFLAKFEDDTEKLGHPMTAVPILRLDGDKNMIIAKGDPMSFSRLMASINIGGGRVVRPRISKKKGTLTVRTDTSKVFQIKTANGWLIMQRTGPGPGGLKVLWEAKPSVSITSHRLHFEEIADRVAAERFEANFIRAYEYTLTNAG